MSNYIEVAQRYVAGWSAAWAGQEIAHVASVASFFLSHIDGVVDNILEGNIRAGRLRGGSSAQLNRRLLGEAARQRQAAYAHFKEIFESERFARLRELARVQRRCGPHEHQNPNYPDTYYVDTLIGPHTVNTLPPQTIDAPRSRHGRHALEQDVDGRAGDGLLGELACAWIGCAAASGGRR